MPYAIPNVRYENGPASAHVRIGWYRSVFNIPHALRGLLARGRNGGPGRARFSRVFARAHRAAKEDRSQGQGVNYPNYGSPIELYPIDTGRLRGTLDLAAENAGAAVAIASWPRHRRRPQLRYLCRGGGPGRHL
jgi:isoquinoline 1-oxidoreductase beta subunit